MGTSLTFESPAEAADLEVVNAWFSLGDSVFGDPGGLENGRHRLWKAWCARPDAVLPISSAIRSIASEFGDPTPRDIDRIVGSASDSVWSLNAGEPAWSDSLK